MLSMASMGSGQGGYYGGLAREDYYTSTEGGEPPGHWFGSGAKRLGLIGQIDNEQFREVFDGFLGHRKLTQNAGRENRHPGWDLTFSCPKSVSVAWSQANAAVAQEIRAAHLTAVERALEYLEKNSALTRRGKGGMFFEKADLIFATFEHGTNRNQEPQLHSHALCLNACVREDGSTGAVYGRPLFQEKMTAGALYRAELAFQLNRRLGLEAVADGRSFKIAGVNEKVCEHFSSRSREIRQLAEDLGIENPSPDQLAILAATSRTHKAHAPRGELFEKWQEEGRELGFGPQEMEELISSSTIRKSNSERLTSQMVAANALDSVSSARSTFTESDLLRAAAEEAQVHSLSASAVIKATRQLINSSPEIVSLGIDTNQPRVLEIKNGENPVVNEPGAIRFSTQEVLDIENELLRKVEVSKNLKSIVVSDDSVKKAILPRPTIKEEQAEMVRYLTQGQGQIKTVIGDAGTGKTYALEAVKEALEAEGFRVKGVALAGIAAKGLSETGIESRTIASALWWLENQPGNPNGFNLDSKTMLIVDEAGMVETRQMESLVRHAQKAGATLVLVGDYKQLQAISHGGAFKEISNKVGGVRLREIIRQQKKGDRQAVKDVSRGAVREFLSFHAAQGNLEISKDRFDARDQLITDWISKGGLTNPKDNLIFCCTNSDVTQLNRRIQLERLARGEVSEDSLDFGRQGTLHKGDRIIFTKPDKGIGVVNGDRGEITAISQRLNSIRVSLDDGQDRTISLNTYSDLRLAYAVTTHRGQGMTVKNAFMLTDETMTDLEITYVQGSRHKSEIKIFTTEQEAGQGLCDLVRRMQHSRVKELATTQAKKFEPVPSFHSETGRGQELNYF